MASTDKLVTSLRLRKIEQEHKSVGALLDKRTLFPINDPGEERKARIEKEKREQRLKNRRDNVVQPDFSQQKNSNKIEIYEKAKASAENNIKEKSFKTEKMLWELKSSATSYSLKRRFEKPDLNIFQESLRVDQKQLFRQKSRDALYSLSQSLRKKFEVSKSEWDANEIFHPDVNAQRAYSLYILQLYKEISAQNIEDPVLEKLKACI